MIHRIVVTGAESTGKSTLAQALSGYYKEPWTKEFVREYVDQLDRPLQQGDLEFIARGQLETEDAGLKQARKRIIHDTNLLSSIIYAQHYFDTKLEWVNRRFKKRTYNLYLLCVPDIPWKADKGQRDSPETRDQLHQIFKVHLDSLKLPYLEICGSGSERLQQAIKAIDTVLNTR